MIMDNNGSKFTWTRWDIVWLLVVFLFSAAVHIGTSTLMGHGKWQDVGQFLYIGQLWANGGLPYVDGWDHKGPVLYGLIAIGWLMGFGHYWGVYVLELGLFLLGMFCVWLTIARFYGRLAAIVCVALLMMLYAKMLDVESGSGTTTEYFALIFNMMGLALFSRSTDRMFFRSLGLGFLWGMIVLLRPNLVASSTLFPLMTALTLICKKEYRLLWRLAGGWIMGMVLIVGSVALYFDHRGGWNDLVDQCLNFNLIYTKYRPGLLVSGLMGNIAHFLNHKAILLGILSWLFSVGIYLTPWRKQWPEQAQYLVRWAIFACVLDVLAACVSGRFYWHYFVVVALPLSVLFAACWYFLMSVVDASCRRVVQWISIGAILAGTCLNYGPLIIFSMNKEKIVPYPEVVADANVRLKPSESVMYWGTFHTGQLYIRTHRKAPSRYFYPMPLFHRGYVNVQVVRAFRADVIRQRATIYEIHHPGMFSIEDTVRRQKTKYFDPDMVIIPEMEQFLEEIEANYQIVVQNEIFTVWQPKPDWHPVEAIH